MTHLEADILTVEAQDPGDVPVWCLHSILVQCKLVDATCAAYARRRICACQCGDWPLAMGHSRCSA
jgi:hypothetical protein